MLELCPAAWRRSSDRPACLVRECVWTVLAPAARHVWLLAGMGSLAGAGVHLSPVLSRLQRCCSPVSWKQHHKLLPRLCLCSTQTCSLPLASLCAPLHILCVVAMLGARADRTVLDRPAPAWQTWGSRRATALPQPPLSLHGLPLGSQRRGQREEQLCSSTRVRELPVVSRGVGLLRASAGGTCCPLPGHVLAVLLAAPSVCG